MWAMMRWGVVGAVVLGWCLTPLRAAAQQKTAPESSTLDTQLEDFRFSELEQALGGVSNADVRDYYEGAAANRRNQLERSEDLLTHAVPGLMRAHDSHTVMALRTLADDQTKRFHYAAAFATYQRMFAYDPTASPDESKEDAELVHLLAEVPPMTIEWKGPVQLKVTRNAIGSNGAELEVGGVREPWLLDTGANYSVVTQSFARRIGVRVLPGETTTASGITGLKNRLQAGVLDTMQVGGAVLHHVVFLVLDDANLKISFGKTSFQINAILGYPVLAELGAITFTRDGLFEAGPGMQQGDVAIPLYMKQLSPVVNLGLNGVSLPVTLDTGAWSADLSLRYYQRFRKAGLRWKRAHDMAAGAGGTVKRTIYLQDQLPVTIGSREVVLHKVSILPSKSNAGLDELYGNLGQALFRQFQCVTFDFTAMQFKVGPVVPEGKKDGNP